MLLLRRSAWLRGHGRLLRRELQVTASSQVLGQELAVLHRLQLHGRRIQVSLGQLRHLRGEGRVHRRPGRLPSQPAHGRRHRVHRARQVQERPVHSLLRDANVAGERVVCISDDIVKLKGETSKKIKNN